MNLWQMIEGMGFPEDKKVHRCKITGFTQSPLDLNNLIRNQALAEVSKWMEGIEVDTTRMYSIIKGKKDGNVDFKTMSLVSKLVNSNLFKHKE